MNDVDGQVEAALGARGGRRKGDEIAFRCIAHEDDNASADWNRKKHAWHCMACGASGSTFDLAERLGIPLPEKKQATEDWQEIGHWDFTTEHGELLFRHVKYLVNGKKRFQFHRPNGRGGWIKNREGVKPVLYRLPELAKLKPGSVVIVAEGEKDADSAVSRGFNATSTPDGAQERGKDQKPAKQRWYAEYVPYFKGLTVVLIPDNDEAGRDFMNAVAASLLGVAASIKWLDITRDLAPKADLTDWFLDGGSAEELQRLIDAAPEWKPAEEPQGLALYPLTDAGNGELFAALYGDRVRYDWARGRWLVWGRHRWQPDPNGELFRLAKEAARERWRAAVNEDSERREAIARWALASENEGKLNAAIARARSEIPIADDGAGWDTQPLLFACSNGVVNLVTGEMRPGRQSDRITMGSPLPYEPNAKCERWLSFLEEVLPDASVREFMRLAIGYSMTGLTREQVWFLCYGVGSNGKGTLFDVLRWVMGDYAGIMAFTTIEKGKEKPIATDMAELAGKRLVLASEAQEHSRFNEARVKSLTGEDPITARQLYERQFTFQPVLKLWIGVNHRPRVDDDSYGFWRRVRAVHFSQVFGPDRLDDTLREKLQAELPGILAWCVRAAVDYCKSGLTLPPAVAIATTEYKEESDVFAPFITERCVESEAAWVQATELYGSYKNWCENQGMRDREIMSATTFGKRMGERYGKRINEGRRRYLGIGLKSAGWTPTLTAGEGCTDSTVRVEGLLPESTQLSRASRGDFLEKPHQPSPPSPEGNFGCEDDDCALDHFVWADGGMRHARENPISQSEWGDR